MEFEKRKAATLASLGCTETDKSPKGTLDTPIIPLLDAINSHPCYFTTSSCSGRISILSQPSPTATSKPKKKASGGSWLFITHDPADPDSVLDLLFPSSHSTQCHPPSQLVFRFEPLIVAVECKDLASAQSLVSIAIASGFRESGITSANKRVIIAIRCSIRLELPLGDTQKIMVSPEYVRYLVEIANEKMEANRKRTEGFLRALRSNGFVGSSVDDGSSVKGSVEDNKSASVCGGGGGGVACNGDQDREPELQGRVRDAHSGSIGVHSSSLSIVPMVIVGEPVESLFIWGHSACTLGSTNHNKVLVFGGFGGMGRHGRRNNSLLLDPFFGTLKAFGVEGGPTPRLGHTSSLVGDSMFVIGGRADPEKILSDVWVLNIAKKEWKLLECSGDAFPPRHRHAAAVVGPNIYVFGGLNNDTISSSFHVLNTDNLQWQELLVSGKQPCPRHSHSVVAFGSQLFLFGGYSGEKALGDLYSFNLKTYQWKKETTAGKSPHARFSHSMFVYKNYLGVIGGCPVRQHFEELSILDLHYLTWRHVKLNSVGKDLFVRSTANVVGDDLVMVGGGASCYAFGTKFSEPMIINLLPLQSLDDNLKPAEIQREHVTHKSNGKSREKDEELQDPQTENMQTLTEAHGLNFEMVLPVASDGNEQLASYWVLQLERKHAKMGKDILKKFQWLDLERKVYSSEDGTYICFPVNEKFCELFCEKQHSLRYGVEGQDNNIVESVEKGSFFNEVDCLKALNILKEHGATKQRDEVVEVRKTAKSPLKIMNEAVAFLINNNGLPVSLLEELPTRWERLGDIIVLPVSSFKSHLWDSIGKELWPTIAKSLNTHRLARQGQVAPTGTRDSSLEILVGDSGWVDHRENGIIYSFDATKCMFSWGNLSEKLRMARLDCRNEVIVDLFAGIGYFVLPFLVRAKAKLVYACEWNPHALEALHRNLQSNSVIDRCIILEGDNKITAPKGVADRVCLGLLPTSEGSWVTAVRALRSEGGILHIHGNVKDSEEGLWTEHVLNSIHEIANNEGYCWEIKIEHLERVKWYAPHIRHVVADVRCIQTQR
ncbi:tRNA wybutosine-synthesizing protein 2/3/4 [Ziziphus jujuba]|uniref:tRNA wybutosine-synthesizing protein 2/3/4 n=1 Tax=Ziziphus jujuba TaxID=326968 RepID=A0ABM3I0A5_ZIZJJ|nr:tRNA wybutosine-synthesizing protein 2/3/4 [Ziziphus jujuba]